MTMTRREALGVMASIAGATAIARAREAEGSGEIIGPGAFSQADTLTIAKGAPMSPERMVLVDRLKSAVEGLDKAFEPRVHKSDWAMPYRLFRPTAGGKLPLVLYLHGSGGTGEDNLKQISLGNVVGSRVWALPASQQRFPCYVVAPQSDRGWIRYGAPAAGDSVATPVVGPGDGGRLALQIVDSLSREFAVDERRIYVVGQSLGGGGAWHLTSQRPGFFAGAVICCGSATQDDPAKSAGTPICNFHGDADKTVDVGISRQRIAAVRKAGGHPQHTEYPGVGHNVWEWAFSEPSLASWLFARRRN